MENLLSRVFQKQKRKKKHMKRLSFITQVKIEFSRPFTGCRKVLRKMPVYGFCSSNALYSANLLFKMFIFLLNLFDI